MPRKQDDGPAWAKGYSVEDLKSFCSIFREHDEGMIHGGFGRYSETALAGDLEAGRIAWGPPAEDGRPLWAMVARSLSRRSGVKDFTGRARVRLEPGTGFVSRVAWQGHAKEEGWLAAGATLKQAMAQRPLALEIWQEHPGERLLAEALGLELAAVKIHASSEMRGVYASPGISPGPYEKAQAIGLARLPILVPSAALAALIEQVPGEGFAQHYSSYNARGSWTALALRGFYDEAERIEKPAEMARKWKREHEEDLEREVRDTPLRARMSAVEPILALMPCASFERIRLMALAPGGGELERHADITDAAAGAEPGKVVRLHVPLVTSERVRFAGWDLEGVPRLGSMKRGGIYYLDTRKPHTAFNGGESERIHLVADVVANEATIRALEGSHEFEPAHRAEPAGEEAGAA